LDSFIDLSSLVLPMPFISAFASLSKILKGQFSVGMTSSARTQSQDSNHSCLPPSWLVCLVFTTPETALT
jgi:hypothetical protein